VPRLQAAGFEEAWPAVDWADWPRMLASIHADVGLAPLFHNAFNQGRSELHRVEFGALAVPTVAERWRGPGPYDVIRGDGVDGFLARGRQEWSDKIGALAKSPQLRADIGGRARERIVAEYNCRDRVHEIADAYMWAATNAGIGRKVRDQEAPSSNR